MLPLKDDLPTSRPAALTLAIIAANVAAFLWQLLGVGMEASVRIGALYPGALLGLPIEPAGSALLPAPVTVVTSMFLHGSFPHILFNMWTLWIFGNNVEDAFGHGRYLVFYLASGVAAALAQTGVAAAAGGADLAVPMIGASGAISGVLGAYLIMFPRARVLTFVPIFFVWLVHLPAFVFLGGWFLLQLLGVFAGPGGSGVAFPAHVGGFIAGLLLTPFLRPRRRSRAAW